MFNRVFIFLLPLSLTTIVGCGGNVASNVTVEDFAISELPSDASNIHYALNPGVRNPNSYIEFTTSEAEFLAWAAQ